MIFSGNVSQIRPFTILADSLSSIHNIIIIIEHFSIG